MAKNKKEEKVLTPEERREENKVKAILQRRDHFYQSAQGRRNTWRECWKMYMSWIDTTKNPYLANLFIPKTHEAVELLAAFLSGPNQSIRAEAEGREDTPKAKLSGKYLEWLWRKVIKARDKISVWIKQAILFGNGVIKVGWDADLQQPFIEVVNITDVLFAYYTRNIQESVVIHRIVKPIADVKKDERYNNNRSQVIPVSDLQKEDKEARFGSYDDTVDTTSSKDETELFEEWNPFTNKVTTIAPTALGYKVLREIPRPYKNADDEEFQPFVKVSLKTNPLPNRAYDIGTVEPTIKLQKAFNDMVNEVFDNVSLINQKGWVKRRGAQVTPMDLVRRPGFIVEVDDINRDLRSEDVSDIKQSALEVIKLLDAEFQQASMVVNLLKGIPGADTATEASIGQQNVQTLLDGVDLNIKEALSELGGMILDITLQYADEGVSVKFFENDERVDIVEFKPEEIKGKYDIKISADRPTIVSGAVKQKQMLDLLAIVSKDANTLAKYPDLPTKIYKRWLENGGEGDVDYFFEEAKTKSSPPAEGETPGLPRGAGLTPESIQRSITNIPQPRV